MTAIPAASACVDEMGGGLTAVAARPTCVRIHAVVSAAANRCRAESSGSVA